MVSGQKRGLHIVFPPHYVWLLYTLQVLSAQVIIINFLNPSTEKVVASITEPYFNYAAIFSEIEFK